MSLDKVFETLDEEGAKQRKELKEKAETEARKIVEESEEETRKLVQSHIEKMDMTLRAEKARITISAELEKKRKITKAKDVHSSKLFSELEKEIDNLRNNKDAYKKIFKNLLLEALNEVSSKEIVVLVDKRDESLSKEVLKELNLNYEIKIAEKPINGVLLKASGNRISVYNTLESRLEKAKQVLKAQLTEVLFSAS